MKRCQILFTVAAKELDVAQGLCALFFNSEAAVGVLHIVCGGDDVIGNFEKVLFITAIGALYEIDNLRMKSHCRNPLLRVCTLTVGLFSGNVTIVVHRLGNIDYHLDFSLDPCP